MSGKKCEIFCGKIVAVEKWIQPFRGHAAWKLVLEIRLMRSTFEFILVFA